MYEEFFKLKKTSLLGDVVHSLKCRVCKRASDYYYIMVLTPGHVDHAPHCPVPRAIRAMEKTPENELVDALEALEEDYNELRKANSETCEVRNVLLKENAELIEENDDLRVRVITLSDELHDAGEAISVLKAGGIQDRMYSIRQDNALLRDKLTFLQNDYNAVKEIASNLDEKNKMLHKNFDCISKERLDLDKENRKLNEALKQENALNEGLKNEVRLYKAEAQKNTGNFQDKFYSVLNENRDIQDRNEMLVEENEGLKNKAEALRELTLKIHKERKGLREELKKALAELVILRTEVPQCKNALRIQRREYDILERSFNELDAHIEELEAQLEDINNKNTSLKKSKEYWYSRYIWEAQKCGS